MSEIYVTKASGTDVKEWDPTPAAASCFELLDHLYDHRGWTDGTALSLALAPNSQTTYW